MVMRMHATVNFAADVKMKQLIIFLALVAVSSCSVWKGGFRIRFDIGVNIGGSFFYDIPRTKSDAVTAGWTQQEQAAGLPVTSVSMYCYSDLIVCCFYDDVGDVAGMQVALPQDRFTPYYDMEATGFTVWTVDNRDFWTIQQYFTTEEILSNARLNRANQNKIIENGGVWLVGVNKEVLQIANTTTALIDSGLFTKQACIPWMGRHYYYKMTESTSCTDEPLYPWFPLVESGELIATGFVVFGKLNLDSGARNWFENPTRSQVKLIVPHGPTCMYDMADNPGLVTMHIYYVDQPWLVSCIFQ